MRVALTGGIASGKSTVSAMLRELGAVVVDADVLARQVVAPGTPGLARVVAAFGPGVLDESGGMDRPAMARLVFADEQARRRLEGIVHPLVHAEAERQERAAPARSVVVHDIPLLAEGGRAGSFDAVLVVDAAAEAQVERMVRLRGWTPEEAAARIRAQASREDRLALATYVIDNTGSLAELRRQVEEVFARLQEQANAEAGDDAGDDPRGRHAEGPVRGAGTGPSRG